MNDDRGPSRGGAGKAGLSAGDVRPDKSTVFGSSAPANHQPSEAENDFIEEVFEDPASVTRAVSVRWASSDSVSACYSHLLAEGQKNLAVDKTFDLTRRELDLLIAANDYAPVAHGNTIAFGMRGARIRGAEKMEGVERIPLEDTRPDHVNFRCVIGYFNRTTGRISAYTASTVPWHEYMSRGVRNNLLPTGCYIYKLGTHAPTTQSRWVTPALRLSDAKGSHSGPATVLRSSDNLVFEQDDDWDECAPSDNIHCAYTSRSFSSLGCQTVKGGMHDGLWADFQRHLKTLPANARVDYVLVTGAEVSIAAALIKNGASKAVVQKALGRLRAGSEGERVSRLQAKLGLTPTGYFGASTKKALVDYQNEHDLVCDGIFSPALDERLGWGVFAEAAAPPVAAPAPAATPTPAPTSGPAPGVGPAPVVGAAPAAGPTPMPMPPPTSPVVGAGGAAPLTPSSAQATPPVAPASPAASAPLASPEPPAATPTPSPQVTTSQAATPTPAPASKPSDATLAAIAALAAAATQSGTSPTQEQPPQPSPAAPAASPSAANAQAAAPAQGPPAATPSPGPTSPQGDTSAPAQQPLPAPTPPPASAPGPVVVKPPATPPAGVSTPPPFPSPSSPDVAVVLTPDTLREFAPKARPDYVTVLGEKGNDVLTRFAINRNTHRFCHFMAQVGHECGGFTIVEENLNYSAKRMVEIFGPQIHSAGITASEAQRLVGNKEAFAERVYGLGNPRKAKDLGNTQPGDGYRYRGRGFLQITGRSAYREMGKRLGFDLEADPDKAGEPLYALMTAAAFWDSRKLNTYADQDNIEIITKRINGGHNGLKDRKERYEKALEIWGEDGEVQASRARTRSIVPGERRTLEYGDLGPYVVEMKRLLSAAGYDGYAMDEDFSRATHMAVVRFQLDHGLPGNGIVDAETWDALELEAGSKGAGTRSPVPVPTAPKPAPGDDSVRRDRGRGRTVVFWAVVLLLAAAAIFALKYVENPRILSGQTVRDLIELGFTALVALAALSLIFTGSNVGRGGGARSRAVSREPVVPQVDEGIRPLVNQG